MPGRCSINMTGCCLQRCTVMWGEGERREGSQPGSWFGPRAWFELMTD